MNQLFQKNSEFNFQPLHIYNQPKFPIEVVSPNISHTTLSKPYRSFTSYLADITPVKSIETAEIKSPYFTNTNTNNSDVIKSSKGLKLESKILNYYPIIRQVTRTMDKTKKFKKVRQFPNVTLHSFFSTKKTSKNNIFVESNPLKQKNLNERFDLTSNVEDSKKVMIKKGNIPFTERNEENHLCNHNNELKIINQPKEKNSDLTEVINFLSNEITEE
ncbi:uncharacterized protein [Centruroides vittatus]|uniref:uncharacterized protein n=1 Tax=Centruroides vittatus TaxID=120091 RepID=UPI0035101061